MMLCAIMTRMTNAYENYLEVREAVLKMIGNCPEEARPSKYWQEEIAGFDHMFDASPLIIEKLRRHSYHLTGLHDYEYRSHHGRNSTTASHAWLSGVCEPR